eukprot:scaffold280950_cov30-Tisochrysis_lutea.AAC.5
MTWCVAERTRTAVARNRFSLAAGTAARRARGEYTVIHRTSSQWNEPFSSPHSDEELSSPLQKTSVHSHKAPAIVARSSDGAVIPDPRSLPKGAQNCVGDCDEAS